MADAVNNLIDPKVETDRILVRPDIFESFDYRDFLKKAVEFLKARGRYSTRTFAKKVGFGSHGYMRMVMKGDRNISLLTAERIGSGLGLTKNESIEFVHLVEFTQETSPEKKQALLQALVARRRKLKARQFRGENIVFFQHWYYSVILEALGTPWNQLSAEQQSESLGISVTEFQQALRTLLDLHLIVKEGGHWVRKDAQLETPQEVRNLCVRQYHKEFTHKGIEALDKLQPTEREFAGLTISLSQEAYDQVRNKIFQVLKDFNAEYSELKDPQAIYHINMQLFPLLALDQNKRSGGPQ